MTFLHLQVLVVVQKRQSSNFHWNNTRHEFNAQAAIQNFMGSQNSSLVYSSHLFSGKNIRGYIENVILSYRLNFQWIPDFFELYVL